MSSQRDSTYFNEKEEIPLPEGLPPSKNKPRAFLPQAWPFKRLQSNLTSTGRPFLHWRQLETFQAYLNGLRTDVPYDAMERLVALQADTLDTVSRIMENGSDASSLRAACYVLEEAAEIFLKAGSCSEEHHGAVVKVELQRRFHRRLVRRRR